MKVLVDYTQIPEQKVGVGIYADNLLKNIARTNAENIFYILVQNDEELNGLDRTGNIKVIKLSSSIFRIFIFRILIEQFYIPYLVLKHQINIVHSLHYSFPLFSFWAKKVVTIHDLTFFLFPELHVPVKRYFFRIFIRMSVIFCDKLICVSESTKNDLISIFSKSASKIAVIPLGKDERFNTDVDSEGVAKVKEKYGITKKYILFIGTLEPRKNIDNLIKSYNDLKKAGFDYQLVIVGRKGWYYQSIFDLVNMCELSDSVIFTGYIDEYEKPYIISGAKAFVYPSIYEGFGIPVLESISCGIPTITSNVSSLPEVAGNAALLIDPFDQSSIFNALIKLLSDETLSRDLSEKSIKQAQKFSWAKTSAMTLNLYKSV
jgi:glycosyltransferase involved in cell wall biosynthesis